MRKQYKISAKHILNMRLKSWEDNGLTYWPLYVQLSYRRKTTHIKSRFINNEDYSIYMTENEYIKYANGENADILLYNEKTNTPLMHWTINSKADIYSKEHKLTAELNAYIIGIPLVEEWQNKEFIALDPDLADCLAVCKTHYKKILLTAAARLDFCNMGKTAANDYKMALLQYLTNDLLPKRDYLQITALFNKCNIDIKKAFAPKDIKHFERLSHITHLVPQFATFAEWLSVEFAKYKEDTLINEVVEYIKATCKENAYYLLIADDIFSADFPENENNTKETPKRILHNSNGEIIDL